MVCGWVFFQVLGVMIDWLSCFGIVRIMLGVDEDFSLKNFQFDFFYLWYEMFDNFFFSQYIFYCIDECMQINNGLGWCYFIFIWMLGINFFFDYDFSCYYFCVGIGVEYWCDYLKLSSNGYL